MTRLNASTALGSPALPTLPTFGQASQRRKKGRPVRPPLSPEEEESLLQKIGAYTLGPLAFVGHVLDTPASILRGLLAGEPERALGGIFDPSERVYGREMLEDWGVLEENEPGLDWGDVAGIGAEIVTDPLLWFLGGSRPLTWAGKAAEAADLSRLAPRALAAKRMGVLGTPKQVLATSAEQVAEAGAKLPGPREARIGTTLGDLLDWMKGQEELGGKVAKEASKQAKRTVSQVAERAGMSIDEIATQPLGGLVGLGLPFSTGPALATARGPGAQTLARALDAVGRKARESALGRVAYQMFSPSRAVPGRRMAPSAAAQEIRRDIYFAEQAGREAARRKTAVVGQILEDARKHGAADLVDDAKQMRRVYEQLVPSGSPEIDATVRIFEEAWEDAVIDANRLGRKLEGLRDPTVKYAPRYSIPPSGRRGQAVIGKDPSAIYGRAPAYTHTPGGTAQMMDLWQDEAILAAKKRGADLDELKDLVARRASDLGIPDTYVTLKGTKRKGRYAKLARDIKENYTLEQLKAGVWPNHPAVDASIRAQMAEELPRATMALYDGLAAYSSPIAKEPGRRTIADVLHELELLQKTDLGGALYQLGRRLGVPEAEIARRTIPEELAESIVRFDRAYRTGDAARVIIPALDDFTNLWKVGVTTIAPAFHVRNLTSALFRSYVDGTLTLEDYRNARKLMRGETVPKAHLYPEVAAILDERQLERTAEQGTRVLRELTYAHLPGVHEAGEATARLGGSRLPPAATGLRYAPRSLRDLTGAIPGEAGGVRPLREAARTLAGQRAGVSWGREGWEMLGGILPVPSARGVAGVTQTANPLVKAGEEVGNAVEFIARATPFLNQLRRGVAGPAAAARRVALAQVDYSSRAFTPFQREVLRRAFPFYAFAHGNTSYVLRQLWERPGGRMAQAIRVLNGLREPGAALPPHIGETAAIPVPAGTPAIGPIEGGDPRYLTGLGLMFEPALQFLGPSAGMEALSQLNVLAKAPLEWTTGESFFMRGPMGGRRLTEMDPGLGRLLSNIGVMGEPMPEAAEAEPVRFPRWFEHVVSNSPLARIVTTLRTVTDPRKRIKGDLPLPGVPAMTNVLTGIRITDVPISAEERMVKEVANRLIQEMPGARTLVQPYVPADLLAEMPPEQQEAYRQLQAARGAFRRRRARQGLRVR